MGITVDLERSGIKFEDPLFLTSDAINGITNQVEYSLHSFSVEFGLKFVANPKIGFAPAKAGEFRIGIIQNAIYEELLYEYEDGSKFPYKSDKLTIDAVAGSKGMPFYEDTVVSPNRMTVKAYADVLITPDGYGELPNPRSGGSLTNAPDLLNSWDQPGAPPPARYNGAWIKGIEKILSFQIWLAVQDGQNFTTLAYIPPFTLAFWLETKKPKPGKPRYSFSSPDFDYGVYGVNGYKTHTINHTIKKIGSSPSIEPASGDGHRAPMTSGPLGGDLTNQALQKMGLYKVDTSTQSNTPKQ
jgi:hypothetical protein